jgi:hypothetical protein
MPKSVTKSSMYPFASNDEQLLVALIANHDCVAD